MSANVTARILFWVGLQLLALAPSVFAQPGGSQLTPAQTVTPAEMTPKELKYYQTLDASATKDFIATRSYVRLCQQVLDHKLPALQLPDKPPGFSVKYLLPTDVNIINRALAENIIAKQSPNGAARARSAPLEMSAAQILSPAALSPKELAYYEKLTDPSAAKSFIDTRSYVRLAQMVVSHKMPAPQLPDKPLNFNRSYLLAGEEAVVNQAISESLAALMQQKLR